MAVVCAYVRDHCFGQLTGMVPACCAAYAHREKPTEQPLTRSDILQEYIITSYTSRAGH